MAGTLSGKDGKINDGTADLADIKNWTLNRKVATHAYASSDTAGVKKRVAGVKDYSGKFDGNIQDNAAADVVEGDSVTLKLYIDATHFYTVPCVIESVDIEVDIDDGNMVTYSAQFSGDGEMIEPSFP